MNRFTTATARAVVCATLTVAGFATAVLSGSMLSAAPASARPASPYVVGGSRAPSTPWEVQLEFTQGAGTYGCTGEQLNASWVLTARHCVDGTDTMEIFQSNSTSSRGRAHEADAWYHAPRGDIGLIHLARPAALRGYAPLGLTYRARHSGTGTIMGYGLRAKQGRPSGLYRATVDLVGTSTDAYRGRAQHLRGVDGASNHGDSGGALVVGSAVVGVCSTGDSADPGSDIHAGANYALLGQSRSWIQHTAGL